MKKILLICMILSGLYANNIKVDPYKVGTGVGTAVIMNNPTSKQQIVNLCNTLCPQAALHGVKNRNDLMPTVIKGCIEKASNELDFN